MSTLSERQHHYSVDCARYLVAFCIAIICFFTTTPSFAKDFSFSWIANPEPFEGYKLYYKKGGDPAAPFNGTDAIEGASPITIGKQTTFTLSGLADNTTYHFTLTAYNSAGESGFSNVVSFFESISPPVLPGVTKDYSFSWTANPEPVEGYKLYYKKGGEPVAPFNGTDAVEGASPIDIGKQTAFQLSGLEDNTTYHFTLTAYNSAGESGFSNVVSVFDSTTTPPGPLTAVITASAQQGVTPFSLTFDGTASTGAISSYNWSFGDGESATGVTASHTYQIPGSYTATLTVADASGQSQQNSILITASEPEPPPPPPVPPTVVISSSSAVGEAPFSVQFDGRGSTSAQPPIVSYSWDFGDGAGDTGAQASHAFTVAGTYSTTLTVADSAGMSNQSSTPVIISAAPPPNQPPVASFTATPTSGNAPISVSFNGSGSNDPDGSISQYVWSFGNGSTASGISSEHIYTEAGDYTVSLQVTDNRGETAVSSQTLSVLPPEEIDFELREVQANQNWTTFTFSKPFIAPVVIAGPPSYADAAPATIRIRNVTSTGFEARVQEWNYLDGKHAFEKFSFLAMEKGVYTLSNGTRIEAGSFTGSISFQKIALQQTYNLTPVILTQVSTYNETDAVTGRMRNGNQSSFEYRMQEQERNRLTHKAETIHYIALEPGKGEYAGLIYETGFTAKSVTQNWFNLSFQSQFPAKPLFIAGMQTYAEGDTATLRNQNLALTANQIKIEEEKSKDTETSHAAETVGYLSIIAAP